MTDVLGGRADWCVVQGDALDVLRSLPDSCVDLIVTDPPYYRVKALAWDRAWDSSAGFIAWIGELAEEWARVLRPNGSLYCFASPRMAARVEVAIGERLNVLNRIVWAKPPYSTKAQMFDKATCRQYFPVTEHVLFAEHYGADNIAKGEAGYLAKCDELRGFVFEPLRAYLAGERDRAGWTTRRVAEAFQARTGSRTVTGMAGHWFERVQWVLPTADNYAWLRDLFNKGGGEYLRREYEDLRRECEDLRREYEYLRREYEDLRREYEDLRRPFNVSPDVPYTDVWTFRTVNTYPGKHPCEKPEDMLRHMIRASSRPGALVLDTFAGSGSTGRAAVAEGRRFIGVELDAQWVDAARRRIAAPPPSETAQLTLPEVPA